MRSVRVLLVVVATVGALVGTAGPAAAQPAVTVTPSTGLAGGDSVAVRATGLSATTPVKVIQCDSYVGEQDYDCYPLTTLTTDAAGALSASVTLADPVYRAQPEGDPDPVYCRADTCRLFLTWIDTGGHGQVVASDPLEFTGSPATIAVTPASGLHRKQWVSVTGTAYGAEGHGLAIVEEACFEVIQGSGCYGTITERTGTVRADGTFAFRVKATRYLADGTDCASPGLGWCEMSVTILDSAGQPDDSFGLSARGQPAAWLTFRR